jgi:hypothetical protein
MGVSRIYYPSILACERSSLVKATWCNHSKVFPMLPSNYNCTYVPKTVHFSRSLELVAGGTLSGAIVVNS